MKNLKHNEQQKTLGREEMESLRRSGTIPPDLDDFDREALEGFQKTQASISIMKKLDRRFLSKSYFLITGSILLTGCIGLSVFLLLQPEKQTVKAKTVSSQNKTMELSDYRLPQNIVALKPISDKKIIRPQEVMNHFQLKKEEDTKVATPLENEVVVVNQLPKQEPGELKSTKPELLTRSFSAKEIYVEDLKLVDYRAYRAKPLIQSERLIFTGTSADMEGKKASGDEFEREKIEIPYYEYIKKTIGIFATGNYNKALYRFEEILASYPDDVNANFYGGLCYFNLGKIEKAKLCFKNCINHNYLNFQEEAEWYLAKCYLAEGNKEAAKTLLTKIVNAKGFYAEQANKILND